MIIETNIKSKIKSELIDAKSFWIATAMISNNGWHFIQKNISKGTENIFIRCRFSYQPNCFYFKKKIPIARDFKFILLHCFESNQCISLFCFSILFGQR